LEQDQDIYKRHYPEDYQKHLGHLHIGDKWYQLKKNEKELTIYELRKRGISIP
jgi:hypothetical protein